MPIRPLHRPRASLSMRRMGCASALALTLALWGTAVVAAPRISSTDPAASAASPAGADAVTRFLVDKGLIAAPTGIENSVVERLRDRASDMVITAMNFLGVPYKRGGNSADHGFDCSGFTRHVFELSLGLVLPRRADEQAQTAGLISIKRSDLKPGDLVFFNTLKRTFSHVGIYVGEGKFIHSPRTGGEVRVEDMSASYWAKRFTGARRADVPDTAALPVVNAAPAAVPARTALY